MARMTFRHDLPPTDDSNGAIGSVLADAVDLIAKVAPRISPDQEILAERILEAVAEAGYGEFNGIIPATAEAFGTEGLDHLEQITEAWAAQPPTAQELCQIRGLPVLNLAGTDCSAQQAGHPVDHSGRYRRRTGRCRRLHRALLVGAANLPDHRPRRRPPVAGCGPRR